MHQGKRIQRSSLPLTSGERVKLSSEKFESEVALYRRQVVGKIKRDFGFSLQEAEDIVEEAILRAWRSQSQGSGFRQDSRFSTWIIAIAVNCARNEQKRKRQPVELSIEYPDYQEIPLLTLQTLLEQAIGHLPLQYHQLANLYCSHLELSYEELAALCNLPIGTVRSRISRIKKRLRPILEGMMGGQLDLLFEEL